MSAPLAAARRGYLDACLEQARVLEGLDARYAPCAAEAHRLAEGFQMKRLRQWLDGSSGSL